MKKFLTQLADLDMTNEALKNFSEGYGIKRFILDKTRDYLTAYLFIGKHIITKRVGIKKYYFDITADGKRVI